MGTDAQTPARPILNLTEVALTTEQLLTVRKVISNVIPDAEVWIFGSRVTGRSRPFSDLDLLLTKPEKLTWAERAALRDGFEVSNLPFCVDLVESAGLAVAVSKRIWSERVRLAGF